VIFGLGEVIAPHGLAFGDGDVGHEVVGAGTVPVLLTALDADHVAEPDGDQWTSP